MRIFGTLLAGAAILTSSMGSAFAQSAPGDLPYRPDAVPLYQYDPTAQRDGATIDLDPARPPERFLTIYSGSTAGVYYFIASALCGALRLTYEQHRIHCVPLRSQGVASNVQLMKEGRAQMIIVQSDTNYRAATGEAPIPGARSVMSLHDEMGVMVVRRASGIDSPLGIRDKRVNLGPKGTALRQLWDQYLGSLGLTAADLRRADEVPPDFNRQGLCGDYLDAFGMWIGHPAAIITDILQNCDARLVGMWNNGLDALLAQHQYYFRQTLPAGTYHGQDAPLESFGIKASLLAYEPMDPDIVYWLTKTVAENVDRFRALHPALGNVDARVMFEKGNFLPFHPGAERYWREKGWAQAAASTN